MSENCIFNDKKTCNNCGECEVCELNFNKKCNNCGKCLELEGYDVKSIKIDEVFEAEELENDFDDENETDFSESEEHITENEIIKDDLIPENDEVWEYIDDIEGVKDLLENEEDNSEFLHEEFPGLIRIKKI